ncbi:MAG: PAS domain-containing sensor histidine kinase [Cyclobacteriaceae bacterium]
MDDTLFSEDNFKRIIEHAPIGIVIIDKELRWRLVNNRFCEIIGYKKKELIGKTFLDITYKEDRDNNFSYYDKLRNGTISEYSFEKRYVKKDGAIIWVRLIVSGAIANGEHSHLVALVQDVDEMKRIQDRVLYKNKELDTLFYKASHDLKAPIKTLEGLFQILKVEYKQVSESDTGHHLGETINKLRVQNESLLQLVRINEVDPVLKPVQPFVIIKKCALAHDKIKLTIKGSANLKIKTDPYFLELIFSKLLHNSVSYSSSDELEIQVIYKKQAAAHCFTLRDNADGITPDVREHIFEMFYKGHEKSKGSGLGLYIVKKATEKLGGDIGIVDNKLAGSAFIITLPL